MKLKFTPRHNEIIGRTVIRRSDSLIILNDPTKVTKFVIVDAVGPDAEAAGIKVGDFIVPKALAQVVFDQGKVYRPLVEEKNVALFVRGVTRDDLLVQIDNGKEFVSFDAENAAESLGEPSEDQLVRSKIEAA